ncbi:TIGR03885 family FMN-dependent LLM class oxidoreductase [Natronobacterium gregoryi]|uniref:LLM class F420-dependent oxidoreductase n=2 Tax=Natronobacterium gregoryi TaxID=44930 RepID=L0AKQ6_NATGS|nr:TIGR03885 family FMN-dependent LLM class oxidoreductase [Natronobacterium gregoryi]AFZ74391.1 putative non-F420 flavinoid oxidoreductase [Natronobacterium gregoryi SP2]PLK22100.1 LLM class F420-dependent oxidoreductase [Natronobacterium gregoryi SP2]SFJ61491.1 probable non-F420 flavinoid oxidoreductase [Natronobacterium gregoryi]
MSDIGYHASHEQFTPSTLLEYVGLADEYGFTDVLASDHFHPWSERQGESGFVWSWLGSAMERTGMAFGTVNAPGYRYHPAIIAQAAATLRESYPERFWLSVGSGQLLNEGITGTDWPIKDDRNARLEECAELMRRLWDGEEVTHEAQLTVERARLYTRPETAPPLVGAALSEETARWLGECDWTDGLITVATPDQEGLERRIEAFRDGSPDGDVYCKVQLSYDTDEDDALEGAYDQWRTNCVPGPVTQTLRTPGEFDELGEEISSEQVAENVRVSADLDEHREWLETDRALGVDKLLLHNVNRNQEQFIEAFGESVLPELE